jgi:hypothetical protein
LPNLTPRIRVEVYIPIRHQPSYHNSLSWVIEEFTQLRGGCTVNENVGGYYLSRANKVIDDRVDVVYCDFPLDWNKRADRTEVLTYCATLKEFLLQDLWEEEILICVYPVSHIREQFEPRMNTKYLRLVHNS